MARGCSGLKEDAKNPWEEIYGGETWYRELGYFITTRKEQYERACKYFDIAVDTAPDDTRALLGRSIARAKAVQYEGALEDINKALRVQPENLVSEAQKALYTYLSCNFEDALVANLTCLPKRKKPDNFAMGVMHCNEAIENCLGERAGRPLRDHFKIIRKLAWRKAKELSMPFEHRARRKKRRHNKKDDAEIYEAVVPLRNRKKQGTLQSEALVKILDSLYSHKEEIDYIPPGPKFPFRPIQEYTSNIENYMASKYLESMYLDKIFLKTLKDNPMINNPNEVSTAKIMKEAKHGYKALSYKQELLRVRRPFYFIKFQEMTLLSHTLLARQMKEDAKIRRAVQADAKFLLNRIEMFTANNQTRLALDAAEKLKSMCDIKHKKYFPDRNDYLKKIYKLVAIAYLNMKRLNPNSSDFAKSRRIFAMLGYPMPGHISRDSVLQEFKDASIDWKKQISIAESRVRKAKDAEELAWLYHDLSRYYMEIKQYELARVYARKCIGEANECREVNWIINARMLIVRINMQLKNKTDAKQELAGAIELAQALNNDTLNEFLSKTMDILEAFQFEDVSSKVHERREKQITSVMLTTEMRSEIEHVFRLMAAMPVKRRMSVMPGVPYSVPAKKPKPITPKYKTRFVKREFSLKGFSSAVQMVNTEKATGNLFIQLMQFHLD